MSIEEITSRLNSRLELDLMQLLPKPTCASKIPHWKWQIEQVKQKLAAKLNPQSAGVTITV